MSVCYWGVVGYGVQVEHKMFNEEKVKELLTRLDGEYDEDNFNIWDDFCIHDLFEEIISDECRLIGYASTANNDNGEYLMYFSNNPWSMSEDEKNLTKKDIEKMIIDTLLPYVKEEYNEEWIKENMHDISLGGEG